MNDTSMLLERIHKLEEALKIELSNCKVLEEENKIMKEQRIPQLVAELDQAEEFSNKLLVDKMVQEKERNVIPTIDRSFFREDTVSKAKAELYKSKFESLRDDLRKVKNDSKIEITKINDALNSEYEKNSLFMHRLEEKESKIASLNKDMELMANQKNNLLSEISVLNNLIQDLLIEKENHEFEVEYLKSEMDSLRSVNLLKDSQMKKNDETFKHQNEVLKQYQSTLIDMEVTNYFFQVTRLGIVVDTKADVSENNQIIINLLRLYSQRINSTISL